MTFSRDIYNYLPFNRQTSTFAKWVMVMIVFFGLYYYYLPNIKAGFGWDKIAVMATACLYLILVDHKISRAVLLGIIYVGYQLLQATFFPEVFRWSTLLFSAGLMFTFVSYYNVLYEGKVFTLDSFIRFLKWFMMLYFVVCIIQQAFRLVGFNNLPLLNIFPLERGIGTASLTNEPSMFARYMLVAYYCYLKCCEYKRGEGPFRLVELFRGEHRWVTIRFLWMMITMGSGTAFVCLILLSLYFVRKNNWFYVIPFLAFIYLVVLPMIDFEQLNRAVSVGNAMTTMDQSQVQAADGSGASRISPLINSINADFTKTETWFGYGIDYAVSNNMIIKQTATLFDDYGFVFYIISLIFNLSCAYRIRSLGVIFMIAGVGGGAGTNIPYTWFLMILMATQRYFYETVGNPKLYSNVRNQRRVKPATLRF